MSYYVLTDNTARGIKNILNSQISRPTSVQRYSPVASYKDNYPHPFEIRWTESLISGGGYMINLPDDCLQVGGYTVNPKKWHNPPERLNIEDGVSSIVKWYSLSSLIGNSTDPSDLSSLSSFSIYIDAISQQPTMVLQSDLSAPGTTSVDVIDMVHVADVVNKKPYADVMSHLDINKIDSPFKLQPLAKLKPNGGGEGGSTNTSADMTFDWKMKDIVFQNGQSIVRLPDLSVRFSDEYDMNFTALRLCYLEQLTGTTDLSSTGKFTWGIDRVALSDISKLELGDTLSAAHLSGTYSVKSTYPLYTMSPTNSIRLDMRDAWYKFEPTGFTGMFTWDNLRKKPGPGGAMVGRTWVEADIPDDATGDGFYQLEVDHGQYPFKATVVKGQAVSQQPTDTKCWIPIYTVSQGQIVQDRRGAFVVPIWEY